MNCQRNGIWSQVLQALQQQADVLDDSDWRDWNEVIQALSKRNAAIRGLVRDPNKATQLMEQGIELAIGDLSQPETLDAAFQDIETVFLVLPNLLNQVELECAFIDAAKRPGTR